MQLIADVNRGCIDVDSVYGGRMQSAFRKCAEYEGGRGLGQVLGVLKRGPECADTAGNKERVNGVNGLVERLIECALFYKYSVNCAGALLNGTVGGHVGGAKQDRCGGYIDGCVPLAGKVKCATTGQCIVQG